MIASRLEGQLVSWQASTAHAMFGIADLRPGMYIDNVKGDDFTAYKKALKQYPILGYRYVKSASGNGKSICFKIESAFQRIIGVAGYDNCA